MAGLWPWGSGEIRIPAGAVVGFVPQKPYLPLGSLRAALAYPGLAADCPMKKPNRRSGTRVWRTFARRSTRSWSSIESYRAASVNASHSRGCCCSDPISSCWTKPRRRWTPTAKRGSCDSCSNGFPWRLYQASAKAGLEALHTRKIVLKREDHRAGPGKVSHSKTACMGNIG